MARPSLREKLASSAVGTLHTFGFRGCSIQDITEAAGVPKGSFFNHFENKEDLAIDALRRYIQGASGYDYTIVNGEVFMDHGVHTGTLAGRVVRSEAS